MVSGCVYTPPSDTLDPDAVDCDLACDPHAACVSPERCECDAGFTGDGLTCVDLDECLTSNGGCAATCANTSGSFECYAPQHCSDVTAMEPSFSTGEVTLYVDGDPEKPWTAFCDASGSEYLSLTSPNFSQYSRGGTDVRTTFTKIRVLVSTGSFVVDIDDKTFTTSTGSLMHSGTLVTSMPYAVAMDCEGSNNQSGVAAIDLTGTPFVVTDPFENRGSAAAGGSTVAEGGRRVTLTGGGNCGWRAPAPAPFNPFNTIGSSPILDLGYAP